MASEQETREPAGDVEATDKPETDGYEPIATDEPAPADDEQPETPSPDAETPDVEPSAEETSDASDGEGESPPPSESKSDEPPADAEAKNKAAEKAAMLARMQRRKAKRRALTDPLRLMLEKAVAATVVLVVLLYAGHTWWVSHRLASFRADVQAEVNKPDGIDKLRFVDDWRVQDVAPGTKRVSRADGKYVVFVWRLPDGKYMVDSVER
ncbi:MAG: hypothetical protein IJS96_03230 [Schwartzia sp.]|nr:hypothetical protein [Schwartzia sp. (in: firmicutes)]